MGVIERFRRNLRDMPTDAIERIRIQLERDVLATRNPMVRAALAERLSIVKAHQRANRPDDLPIGFHATRACENSGM